jgi:general nucleoside transport system ATP-binding protein
MRQPVSDNLPTASVVPPLGVSPLDVPPLAVPRLELQHITKRYPSVVANDDISLIVAPGELHAVLGENGAGKSTLMKIIYGAVTPDQGSIKIDGAAVRVRSPQAARALGVSMVYQHFSLFETLSVAENVWLGLDRSISLSKVKAEIGVTSQQYGLALEQDRPVHTLSVGERQRIEIIRALLTHPRLLILDEPTSVLTPQAVERLFETLRQLSAQGCSILYISHKLHEIRELCSTCTVLRDGRVTGQVDPRLETNASLSRLMIGAEPPRLKPRDSVPGEQRLAVRSLQLEREHQFGTDLDQISLELCAGEIVGIAGVSGNGQQELLKVLSGEDQRTPGGCLFLGNSDVGSSGPNTRRALGLHVVPEERLGRGAVPMMSLAENLPLTRREAIGTGGWIDRARLQGQGAEIIQRFRVKAAGPNAPARSLSGGNLQKYIVGREVSARPKVLVLAQPTWGVDVGAAAQIRAELLQLRDEGCALLVISEELDELFEISDRLYVIARGRLSPSVAVHAATVELIGEWMSGLWPGPSSAVAS